MYSAFAVETPSRVLRNIRAHEHEADDLSMLPPAHEASDVDYTTVDDAAPTPNNNQRMMRLSDINESDENTPPHARLPSLASSAKTITLSPSGPRRPGGSILSSLPLSPNISGEVQINSNPASRKLKKGTPFVRRVLQQQQPSTPLSDNEDMGSTPGAGQSMYASPMAGSEATPTGAAGAWNRQELDEPPQDLEDSLRDDEEQNGQEGDELEETSGSLMFTRSPTEDISSANVERQEQQQQEEDEEDEMSSSEDDEEVDQRLEHMLQSQSRSDADDLTGPIPEEMVPASSSGTSPSSRSASASEPQHLQQGVMSANSRKLHELEALLEERDDELSALQHRLEDRTGSFDVSVNGKQALFLLKQEVGDLSSRLAEAEQANAGLARQSADDKQRHEALVATLHARADELLLALEAKDSDLEAARREMQGQEDDFARKMEGLEQELVGVMESQEKQVEEARLRLGQGEGARREEDDKLRRRVEELESENAQLQREKESDHGQIVALEDKVNALDREVTSVSNELASAREEQDELRRQLGEKDSEAQQMEEALEESEAQLLSNDAALDTLRSQLASERATVNGLKAQIAQVNQQKPKSQSPLVNEISKGDTTTIANETVLLQLEDDLANANEEIEQLKAQLAAVHVEKAKENGGALKVPGPNATPDKSIAFKSILGLKTPKTPGQFLSSMSGFGSPNTSADATITPLLAQIRGYEQEVSSLRQQLLQANAAVDEKLSELEEFGTDAVGLGKQLAASRKRVAELEAELKTMESMWGQLRKELRNVQCKGCGEEMDVSKVVTLPSSSDFGRSFSLTDGPATLLKDVATARKSVNTLESTLSATRNRLHDLTREQTDTLAAKAKLEARLAEAERELRSVKTSLIRPGKDDDAALRRDKEQLVMERARLAKELAGLNGRVGDLDVELVRSRSTQAEMKRQIEAQLADLAALRAALDGKDQAYSRLKEEKTEILRSVRGLQRDLESVRQGAEKLEQELDAVRRGRTSDSQVARMQQDVEALKAELRSVERREREHVCAPSSSNSADIDALQKQHVAECKGLLVAVKYAKLRATREATFRDDLAWQKLYLAGEVAAKQASIDTTISALVDMGLRRPPSPRRAARPSFKAVAEAIRFAVRLDRLAAEWRKDSAIKHKLREKAYPAVRGRPFPR